MARIRTIKPEFFKNWKLYQAEAESGLPLRISFAGLWTVCDREGRFEWIPQQLRLDALPYDDVDFSRVLDALWTRGYVEKYAVDGHEFGWIPGFADHQVINNRESSSILPEPNENNILTRDARVSDAKVTRIKSAPAERKGKEGKGREGEGADTPPCPHQEIVSLYHETLPMLPQVKEWTDERQSYLRSRWREKPERQSLEWWRKYFEYVKTSDFLIGNAPPQTGKPPFMADLEWLVRPSNFVKVIEGKYEGKVHG